MKIGKFDTDTDALRKRIRCHDQYSVYDLNEWIFKHLELENGLSILDLGCGNGKQTLPLAQMIGDSGHILGVDISSDALEELSRKSEELGLSKRISLLHAGLDDLDDHLDEKYFDRVVASYSMYYADDPEEVFKAVAYSMKNNGIIFYCGPANDNNSEIKEFHYKLLGGQLKLKTEASIFMEETSHTLVLSYFKKLEVYRFENPLIFDSASSLYDYWSSHNIYEEKLDDKFQKAARKHFENNNKFRTTKRVVGVKAFI